MSCLKGPIVRARYSCGPHQTMQAPGQAGCCVLAANWNPCLCHVLSPYQDTLVPCQCRRTVVLQPVGSRRPMLPPGASSEIAGRHSQQPELLAAWASGRKVTAHFPWETLTPGQEKDSLHTKARLGPSMGILMVHVPGMSVLQVLSFPVPKTQWSKVSLYGLVLLPLIKDIDVAGAGDETGFILS